MFFNSFLKAGSKSIQLPFQRTAIINKLKQQFYSTVNKMEKIIAIGQMCSTNNKESNRKQVEQIVESAVEQKACFVFLPECCDYVGSNRNETIALSETLNGESVEFYKQLAKKHSIWLSLGGIHEAIYDENGKHTNKLHNSHIIINNIGELIAVYRKLHLFDVQTPDFKFRESEVVNPGNYIVSPLTNTPLGGGLGLMICYDLRFPEISTVLRKNGATILTYPSAFAYSTGIAHWESLLRARAIENQCYVIAPAQIGFHNAKRQSYGRAMVVDPWGKILTECENIETVQCKTATINLEPLHAIRERVPCFSHRRGEIYALAAVQMITPAKSTSLTDDDGEQLEIAVKQQKPYFIFEKHDVPKSTIFYETPLSLAFTNVTCVVPGHILVATRRCVGRLKDLKPEEITDFFLTVCKCQRLLEENYKTTSSTVTVQDGEFAGQTVKHVHCHIMPRKEGDFEHNDQIYIELNKHDHPNPNSTNGSARRQRDIEERTAEADQYRKLLTTFKAF